VTRYVIVGAGAVGVTLAAEFRSSGAEVVLVGRGRQLELLRAGRVRYFTPDGSQTVDAPTASGPGEVTLTASDVLVIATKTQQAAAVIDEWAWQPVGGSALPAAETLPVLTLQNGLDVERTALRRFATVVGAVVWVPATYVADGEVSAPAGPARGVVWLGAYPDGPAPAVATGVAADLRSANFEAQVVDDLSRWKAGKLLSSITFVLDALYAPGPDRDRAANLVQAEAREVLAGAGLDPANLRTESTVRLDRFAPRPIEGHERGGNSTWQSLRRARDVETDFLNGEIVLLARQQGRRAPVNEALVARIHRSLQDGTPSDSLPREDLLQLLAGADVAVDRERPGAEVVGA
jgi:thiosulfate/3-mercaptopyruvate sulfurtransferase